MQTQNASSENKYLCEARQPGKAPHTFPTPGAYEARCLCDAQGWEFIRCYKPGGDSDRPPGRPAKGDRPLSKAQVKCLVTECNKTWKHLSNMGVIADTFDDFRHAQVYIRVRREGLSHCLNSHYLPLLNHFRAMRGAEHTAPRARRQSGEGGDTADRRNQILANLAAELGRHARRVENPQTDADMQCAAIASTKGGVINEAYLLSIARAKNPGTTLHDTGCLLKLPASRLEHLLYTLRNRIAAREGRGETKNRNKGQ